MLTDRYVRPEMGAIWTDEALFASWMEVEVAAAEAMAAEGIVPADAAAAIRERAGFDIARIHEIEKTVQHDVVAFTQSMAEHVGAEGRWIHFGLTSSDVVDTALATRLVRSADLILERVEGIREVLKRRAEEHRRTVMVGRTHGVHAEPMTFGMKLALWWAEMGRNHRRLTAAREAVSVGKLSGAVGTFAHLPPSVEKRVCDALGLRPAAISTQVVQRDRHAELAAALAILAGTLEKIATEIRNLQRTEIRELEEPFGRGQKGSSAMPHKRNPVGCEQVCGLARIIRANTLPAIENIALWNERDISHSSAERMAIPQSFLPRRPHPAPHDPDPRRPRGARRLHAREPEPDERHGVQRPGAARPRRQGDLARGRLPDGAGRGHASLGGRRHAPGTARRGRGDHVPPEPRGAERRVRSRRPAPPPRRGLRAGLPGGQRMKFRVRVLVRLRPSVYDPQGEAIRKAIAADPRLSAESVRQGKMFDLEVKAGSPSEAKTRAEEIASRVLANPVLEDFSVQVLLD